MNTKILLVLFLSIFTAVLGQGLVVPLLPVYANSMGASGFIIGLIFGIFSISRSLFLPIFGNLSDKKGRKPFIVWGLSVYFFASVAFLLSHSVMGLVVIRMLQGVASAMIVPVSQAYAAEISPSGTEGKIMGIMNIALYLGLGAGPVFGGTIKDMFGIHASFGAMGIACLIGVVLSLSLLPGVKEENINVKRTVPKRYRILMRDKNVMGVFIIRFGYMLCVGSLWSFLPLIADTKYGMSSSAIGGLLSLLVLTSAAMSYPVGLLADNSSKRLLIFIGGIMTLVGMLYLYSSNSIRDLFVVVVLLGLGGGFLTTASTAMSAVIGKKLAATGSVMSLMMVGHSAGMFTGPLLGGIVMDITGSVDRAFEIGAIICLILLVIAYFLTTNYNQFVKGEVR